MQKATAILLTLVICLSLCACDSRISEEEAIAIALEEAESRTGLDLTEDMATCEKLLGTYRVMIQTYELGTPVTITVDAKTGAIVEYRSQKLTKL